MELKINIEGIFADEDGSTVNDSIRDSIIAEVTEKIYRAVWKQVEVKTNEILTTGIKEKLGAQLDELIPQLMDHKFTEVTSWGQTKDTFTVRERILKALEQQCVFKDSNYSSERNAFTSSLRSVVDEKMNLFKKEYNREVDAMFVKEAMEFAQQKLQERLGIKK
jgi:hypothetical protein